MLFNLFRDLQLTDLSNTLNMLTYIILNYFKHKTILIFLILLCNLNQLLNAQSKLIGMGRIGGGCVFAINEDGTDPQKLVDFSHGIYPNSTLEVCNGRLWGTTGRGG